jgi:hypothetical protein
MQISKKSHQRRIKMGKKLIITLDLGSLKTETIGILGAGEIVEENPPPSSTPSDIIIEAHLKREGIGALTLCRWVLINGTYYKICT